MKIRSITCFGGKKNLGDDKTLSNFEQLVKKGKTTFQQIGIEVQSARLASVPFMEFFPIDQPSKWSGQAQGLEARSMQAGFNYLSLGCAKPEKSALFPFLGEILEATKNTFVSALIADPVSGISLPALQQTAKVIQAAMTIEKDGFANLRFAALANVKPFTPFFPAAYSQGNQSSFALAIQGADEVLTVFQNASSLNQARSDLLDVLQKSTSMIEKICMEMERTYGVKFRGIDLSPAPFPDEFCSIGKAIESLGISTLGNAGSLTAVTFLADILQRGNWKKTGFNGIMLPVLEDSYLAQRSAQGSVNVYDFLMYSAVCGTGLDTVPLPGNITAQEIEPLLLDMAALALRLDKPLTARLMPIPGKQAGDLTEFKFDYFANGRVLDYRREPLTGKLKGNETFLIIPRIIKS
jgi:uncharacterized protein (UPF0210 family)